MAPARVAIIVLNYHRLPDTRECLDSVFRGSHPDVRVILLDLGSSPGQRAALQREHPGLEVLALAENRGYAGNNNVGIRLALAARADWVLLLNDDTRIDPACVAELTAAADGDPRVGIVGPLVYHHGTPSVIQSAGGRLDDRWWPTHIGQGEADRGQFSRARPVDWVTGCAIQIRRPVFERIGLLDERFFTYWEETEFCVRARRDGWGILHVPRARVWHKGGQPDRAVGPEVAYYMVRNRFFLLARHRAPLAAWVSAWTGTLRALASMTLRPGPAATPAHRAAVVRGLRDFLRHRGGPMPPTRRPTRR